MRKIIYSVILCVPFISLADVSSDLNNFYNSLGYATNATSAHAYQGQEAGYYSAGSLYLRGQTRTISPVHIDVPSLKAGCGGIDLFMGGASFINAQTLVNFANNIMSAAPPYFLQLALETYAPQVNDAMTKLQYWAQQINNMNMNSCAIAQDTIGGLWPQHTGAQEQICRDLGTQQNAFSDWAAATQACGAGGQGNQFLSGQTTSQKAASGITSNVNIVWSSILASNFISNDPVLAEFFMSLSGTVTFDANGNATVFPSLAKNADIINALLYGGTAQSYQCDETVNCLNPTVGNLTIDAGSALTQHVASLMADIQQRVQTDVDLTDEEKGFLNLTSTPVLTFIQQALTTGTNINTTDYATLIAQDLVSQYLSDTLSQVQVALSNSNYQDAQKQMENSLAQAQQFTQDLKNSVQIKVIASTALVQNSMSIQKQVAGQLSTQLQANLGS